VGGNVGKGGGVFVGALGTSGRGVAVGIRRRVGVTVISAFALQAIVIIIISVVNKSLFIVGDYNGIE
jgi:hypothetical protein